MSKKLESSIKSSRYFSKSRNNQRAKIDGAVF